MQFKHLARLAVPVAIFGLAACSESQEPNDPNAGQEAAEQQNEGTWDVGSTTQEAVTDTQAAANEAAQTTGQAIETTGDAIGNAASDAAATTEQAVDSVDRPVDPGQTEPDRAIGQ